MNTQISWFTTKQEKTKHMIIFRLKKNVIHFNSWTETYVFCGCVLLLINFDTYFLLKVLISAILFHNYLVSDQYHYLTALQILSLFFKKSESLDEKR